MKKYIKYLVGGLFAVVLAFFVFGSAQVSASGPNPASFIAASSVFDWFTNPFIHLLTNGVDTVMGWIGDSLRWEIADQIIGVWSSFLPYANIVLAIAFLAIVYSTATGVGMTNYSVKKLLPKLIIVAIAINISYYICMALADLSNIVGSSIIGLFPDPNPTWNAEEIATQAVQTIGSLVIIIFVLLSAGTALLSLLIIFVSITARFVLLFVLVIISPLAIACALLPQTDKWFKKWLDNFVKMLIVYPIFMIMWGAVRWIQADHVLSFMGGFIGDVASILLPIAPMFMIMPIMEMGGGMLNKVTGIAQKGIQNSPLGSLAKAGDRALRGVASDAFNRRKEQSENHRQDVIDGRTDALTDLAAQHGYANVASMLGAAQANPGSTLAHQVAKIEKESGEQYVEATALDNAAAINNDGIDDWNNSRARKFGNALVGGSGRFLTGETSRAIDNYLDERFGENEKARHDEGRKKRLEKARDAFEKANNSSGLAAGIYGAIANNRAAVARAQMRSGNAKLDYDNEIKEQQVDGVLHINQVEANRLNQLSGTLDKQLKADSDRQSFGRQNLLDRARIASNISDTFNSHISARANLSDELEIQGGNGSALDKARADKMKNATEQEVKNAIGRQSKNGGVLADITKIENAEIDRGTQIETDLKAEATDQRRTRVGEGGSIEVERSKMHLKGAEEKEAKVIESAKRKKGGTGELSKDQTWLDRQTREADIQRKHVEAQTEQRKASDNHYVDETRKADNITSAAKDVITTKQNNANAREVRVGSGTGHTAAQAKISQAASDSNYKDTVNRQSDNIGGVEGTLFRAARSARTAEDREKESLKHLNEVTAVQERRARTGRGGTRSMAEVGRRATEQKGFEEQEIEEYRAADRPHNETMARIKQDTKTFTDTSEGQGEEALRNDARAARAGATTPEANAARRSYEAGRDLQSAKDEHEEAVSGLKTDDIASGSVGSRRAIDASQNKAAADKEVEHEENKAKQGRDSAERLNTATDRAANSKTDLEAEASEQQNNRDPNDEGSRAAKARVGQRKKTADDVGEKAEKDTISDDAEGKNGDDLRRNVDDAVAAAHALEGATDREKKAKDDLTTTFGTRAFANRRVANQRKRDAEVSGKKVEKMAETGKANDDEYNEEMARLGRDIKTRTDTSDTKQSNTLAHDIDNGDADALASIDAANNADGTKSDLEASTDTAKTGRNSTLEAAKTKLKAKSAATRASTETTRQIMDSAEAQDEQKSELEKKKVDGEESALKQERIAEDEELSKLATEAFVEEQRAKNVGTMVNTDIAKNVKNDEELAKRAGGGGVHEVGSTKERRSDQMAKTYGQAGAISTTNAEWDERKKVSLQNLNEYPDDAAARNQFGSVDGKTINSGSPIATAIEGGDRAYLAAAIEYYRGKGEPDKADTILKAISSNEDLMMPNLKDPSAKPEAYEWQQFVSNQSIGREDDYQSDSYGKLNGQMMAQGKIPFLRQDFDGIDVNGEVSKGVYDKYLALADGDASKIGIKEEEDKSTGAISYRVASDFTPTGPTDSKKITDMDKDFEERWANENIESYEAKMLDSGYIVKRLNGGVSKIAEAKSKKINFGESVSNGHRKAAQISAAKNWSASDVNATSLKTIEQLLSGHFLDANGKEIPPGTTGPLDPKVPEERIALENMLKALNEVASNENLRGGMTPASIQAQIDAITSLGVT